MRYLTRKRTINKQLIARQYYYYSSQPLKDASSFCPTAQTAQCTAVNFCFRILNIGWNYPEISRNTGE